MVFLRNALIIVIAETDRSRVTLVARSKLAKLKVQSRKLYDNKYMIASTQIRNTKIFAFIAALVFKLLSHKILFINRKDGRKC